MGSKESGRPKYTPQVHAKIIENLKLGAFKKHAANAAGIALTTLESWLERGAEGIEPYATLLNDVETTIAEDALRNQAIISKAAAGAHDGDWKAAAWNLQKKFPKLYGEMSRGHDLSELRKQDPEPSERVFSPWKRPEAN
jgi:hypothetical protein